MVVPPVGIVKARTAPGVAPSGTRSRTFTPPGVFACSTSPGLTPSGTVTSNVSSAAAVSVDGGGPFCAVGAAEFGAPFGIPSFVIGAADGAPARGVSGVSATAASAGFSPGVRGVRIPGVLNIVGFIAGCSQCSKLNFLTSATWRKPLSLSSTAVSPTAEHHIAFHIGASSLASSNDTVIVFVATPSPLTEITSSTPSVTDGSAVGRSVTMLRRSKRPFRFVRASLS